MQDATVNDIHHHLNKLRNRRARVVATHGRPGRGGNLVDATELLAKIDSQISDWLRILAFAEQES